MCTLTKLRADHFCTIMPSFSNFTFLYDNSMGGSGSVIRCETRYALLDTIAKVPSSSGGRCLKIVSQTLVGKDSKSAFPYEDAEVAVEDDVVLLLLSLSDELRCRDTGVAFWGKMHEE